MSFLIAEDNLNISLKDITVTGRDGRVSQLDQVYIRGSMVRFFIVPDMLQNAPMYVSYGISFFTADRAMYDRSRFKRVGPNAMRGRGIGTARGRATIMRGMSSVLVHATFHSLLSVCQQPMVRVIALLFCLFNAHRFSRFSASWSRCAVCERYQAMKLHVRSSGVPQNVLCLLFLYCSSLLLHSSTASVIISSIIWCG